MNDRKIALLRGINVGRAKRVAMSDLRVAVEALGYTDVRTVLNSGNVVFNAPGVAAEKAAARIEAALPDALGVASKVTGLAADVFATVVAENPLPGAANDSPSRLMVVFLAKAADRAKLDGFAGQDWAPDRFGLASRAAYMWCPQGLLVSRLAEAVARTLGPGATSRNWSTVMKLHALACR
ncbi:MAG: DUF1697 domain-containing protein [Caulobacteraceae bacterium]